MQEFYGQWVEGMELYFVHINTINKFRFNHWETQEERRDASGTTIKTRTQIKFKLTLVY